MEKNSFFRARRASADCKMYFLLSAEALLASKEIIYGQRRLRLAQKYHFATSGAFSALKFIFIQLRHHLLILVLQLHVILQALVERRDVDKILDHGDLPCLDCLVQ